jgi:putative transposase
MSRKSKFTEQEIIYALKQVEAGVPLKEPCRKYGVSEQTFYRWRSKYGGMAPSELQRLKQLEQENQQLKKLVADLSLDKHVLQEVLAKKSEAGAQGDVLAVPARESSGRRVRGGA